MELLKIEQKMYVKAILTFIESRLLFSINKMFVNKFEVKARDQSCLSCKYDTCVNVVCRKHTYTRACARAPVLVTSSLFFVIIELYILFSFS